MADSQPAVSQGGASLVVVLHSQHTRHEISRPASWCAAGLKLHAGVRFWSKAPLERHLWGLVCWPPKGLDQANEGRLIAA
jgi:hypothetical protein